MPVLGSQESSVFYVVKQKNSNLLRNMLQSSPESIGLNTHGQTILHAAVLAKNHQSVKVICRSKLINVNQLDRYGKTALDYAVEHGYHKIIRILYKNNGKVTSVEHADYVKKTITRPFKILFFMGLFLPLLGLSAYILAVVIIESLLFLALPVLFLFCFSNPALLKLSMLSSVLFYESMIIGGLIAAAIGGFFTIISCSGWINRAKRNVCLMSPLAYN